MKLEATAGSPAETSAAVRDTDGTGTLPIQAVVAGSATFRVLGRVSPEAPWVEVKEAGTVSFLESFSWLPYLSVEVLSGSGQVTLYIGEK